jgi:hypothetical protein
MSMRHITADVLPGSKFRRHVFYRYLVLWTKA